jgi:hypothetical protein
MNIDTLKYKLKKLNSNLRIYEENRIPHHGQFIYGLYCNYFGHDNLIGGVSGPYSPEYSKYEYESDILVLRGWRDLLHVLINKGYCSKSKAERVFRVDLRGTYDFLNEAERRAWMKKIDKYEEQGLKPGQSAFMDRYGKMHALPDDDKLIKELMRESQLCPIA